MANLVVGDIQACYTGLKRLLTKADFNPKRDTLWAVGDLIGRGPDALKTIDYLMSLGSSFNSVLGNHDLHFLAVTQGIKENRDKEGFGPLLKSKDKFKVIDWLRQKPLAAIPQKGYFLSHAGLYPLWNEKQAMLLANETSNFLQSDKWKKLLTYMYGDESCRWHKDLKGLEKHKFVIDAFTRMRYVTNKAELNFSVKTSPEDAPKGLQPWYEHSSLEHSNQLLFGHWAALEGKTTNKRIHALDTGYIWGGKLTLINLDNNKLTSIKADS